MARRFNIHSLVPGCLDHLLDAASTWPSAMPLMHTGTSGCVIIINVLLATLAQFLASLEAIVEDLPQLFDIRKAVASLQRSR